MTFKTMVQSHLDMMYDESRFADPATFQAHDAGAPSNISVIADPDNFSIEEDIAQGERVFRMRKSEVPDDPVGGDLVYDGRRHAVSRTITLAGGLEWEVLCDIGSEVP